MDVSSWLFGGWSTILRTLVVGVGAYVALVLVLRTSGKRTLAKLNAFDLVVTVALGSTLATMLLSQSTNLAQGTTAFLVLAGLQALIAWGSTRSQLVARVARSEPALLVLRGQILHDALRDERVTEGEVRSAIRSAGMASIDEALAVVLEGNGTIAVIRRGDEPPTALTDVPGAPAAAEPDRR